MYHIVVVAPNQVETPLLQRVRSALVVRKSPVLFEFCDRPEDLIQLLQHVKPDYICLSTVYSHQQEFGRLEVLAQHMKRTKRLLPLIYLVDWSTPFPALLGTSWSSQVGILHSFSSPAEIIDLFQRLDGCGTTVGL